MVPDRRRCKVIKSAWVDISGGSVLWVDGQWVGGTIRKSDERWVWSSRTKDEVKSGACATRELAKSAVEKEVCHD